MENLNLQEFVSNLSPEQVQALSSLLAPKKKEPPQKLKKAYNWQHFELQPQVYGESVNANTLRDTGLLPDLRMRYDYYSAVWKDHTFKEVLDYYQLTPYFEQILSTKAFRDQFKTDELVRLSFNNIVFSVPYSCVVRCSPLLMPDVSDAFSDLDLDNIVFPRILLTISGQGLEWMRGHKIMVETVLRVPPDDDHRFSVTRCDFAFDFKNYKYELLTDCMEFLQNPACLTPKGRLQVAGAGNPLAFSIKRGDSEIIYVGKSTSDRLLRIYDKKLEQSKHGAFVSQYWGEPSNVLSWLRIEWQMRGSKAMNMLFNDSKKYWLYILKELYAFYSFRDMSKPHGINNPAPIADFWAEFWDFNIIDARYDEIIGENGHFV